MPTITTWLLWEPDPLFMLTATSSLSCFLGPLQVMWPVAHCWPMTGKGTSPRGTGKATQGKTFGPYPSPLRARDRSQELTPAEPAQ
jgi:hypothetical protein